MRKQKLMTQWQIFIGHAKKSGATDEELEILVAAFGLLKKYLPIKEKK